MIKKMRLQRLAHWLYIRARWLYITRIGRWLEGLNLTGETVEANKYWNDWYSGTNLTDNETIETGVDNLYTRVHYAGIEEALAQILRERKVNLPESHVVDIGTGAGHWIQFFDDLGASRITGLDIAKEPIKQLSEQHAHNSRIQFKQCDVAVNEIPDADIIVGVGVMFHIVDEKRFQQAVENIIKSLEPDGVALLTGSVGWFSYVAIRDDDGSAMKRRRSKRHWRRVINKAGGKLHKVRRVKSPKSVVTPASNVLVIQPGRD